MKIEWLTYVSEDYGFIDQIVSKSWTLDDRVANCKPRALGRGGVFYEALYSLYFINFSHGL